MTFRSMSEIESYIGRIVNIERISKEILPKKIYRKLKRSGTKCMRDKICPSFRITEEYIHYEGKSYKI